MKLLPRADVQKQRATERKLDVDEGMKLAKKIDVLRETSALEEQRLAKFRDESFKEIKKEITTLLTTRDGVLADIKKLEDIRDDLRRKLKEFIQ